MRNKILYYAALTFVGLLALKACAENLDNELKIQLLVTDSLTGEPINGAIGRTDDMIEDREHLTDENGRVDVRTYRKIRILTFASKDGYYRSVGPKVTPWVDSEAEDKIYGISLKQRINPIGLHAKTYMHHTDFGGPMVPPLSDVWVGYDLKEGDWLPPYGNGSTADMIFRETGDRKGGRINGYYNRTLEIKFSNDKDGLLPFMTDTISGLLSGSYFASDYAAPKEGYSDKWSVVTTNRKKSDDLIHHDPNRNYYFRVRTVLDEEGNIISAHYGKIYGDFPNIIHYFNPTPNDRNIEFDIDNNLTEIEIEYDPRNPEPYQQAKWAIKVERP